MSSDRDDNGDMDTTQKHLPFDPDALVPFSKELFDREEKKAARILWSILETRSPRKSDRSQVFPESSEGANHRTIDRALRKLDTKMALMRLYDPERVRSCWSTLPIIERKRAKSTEYVRRLSDGKTLGFCIDRLCSTLQGQGDPVPPLRDLLRGDHIAEEATSRKLSWRSLVWQIKELVGQEMGCTHSPGPLPKSTSP